MALEPKQQKMENVLLDTALCGSNKNKDTVNKEILLHTIDFIKLPEALKDPRLTTNSFFEFFLYFFFSFQNLMLDRYLHPSYYVPSNLELRTIPSLLQLKPGSKHLFLDSTSP